MSNFKNTLKHGKVRKVETELPILIIKLMSFFKKFYIYLYYNYVSNVENIKQKNGKKFFKNV